MMGNNPRRRRLADDLNLCGHTVAKRWSDDDPNLMWHHPLLLKVSSVTDDTGHREVLEGKFRWRVRHFL
jgi:hypothetical protein